jgi:ubiquinone/menaquinone biosynthesis C-methylase UbiE
MQRFTDQTYLTKDQYKDSSNLDARLFIHQKFSVNSQGWHNWVFDQLLQLPVNAAILELGCGNAVLWKESAKRIPAEWTITLTDLSDGMLDSAWRNLVVNGRRFNFQKVDAQAIPFDDGAFDAVIANHMLYHVSDRFESLKEIKRVLKDGGKLFASTVGEDHMKEMYGWLKRVNTNPRADMFVNPFTLENGLAQLQAVFPNATVNRYVDNLKVTEVRPLVNYIRSSIAAQDISEPAMEELEKDFSAAFKRDGEIFITKDSGLFTAIK